MFVKRGFEEGNIGTSNGVVLMLFDEGRQVSLVTFWINDPDNKSGILSMFSDTVKQLESTFY